MAALEINEVLMRTARRAENAPLEVLKDAFVPVPSLLSQLNTTEHQVLFGRRGTGKTHVLRHLQDIQTSTGAMAIYLDLRKIGSAGDVFSRHQQEFAQLATSMLVDVVEHIHGQIYERALTDDWSADLGTLSQALDRVAEAATEIRVVGEVEVAQEHEATAREVRGGTMNLALSRDPKAEWHGDRVREQAKRSIERRLDRGHEVHHVLLGPLSTAFQDLAAALRPHPVWLLVDEWSAVPLELQPILADLLRRTLFATAGIIVKISAIHARSRFAAFSDIGPTVGLELGADTAATLDLDDFLLFRNDVASTLQFYTSLLHHHLLATLNASRRQDPLQELVNKADSTSKITSLLFEDALAFHTLVLGAEGVPRDLLQIAGLAAGFAYDQPIRSAHVIEATRSFFLRDKEPRIPRDARFVFARLMEECGRQKTRVIPLRREGESDDILVQNLYDARILHRVGQGLSLHAERSTELYDIYVVDSGAFLGLPTTNASRAGHASFDPAARFTDAAEVETRSRTFVPKPPRWYRERPRARR